MRLLCLRWVCGAWLVGWTMSAHTPGPWTAHQYGVRDAGGYICALKWPSLYTGQDERYWRETAERQADARLIAAAPDLYEFAKAYVHWIEIGATPEKHLYDMAKAALAKTRQS